MIATAIRDEVDKISVSGPIVGVLALQGGFRGHREAFERLGVCVIEVRRPDDLMKVAALALPGGESTVIAKLMVTSGLLDAISRRLTTDDLALFGTCAGMIVSADTVLDGTPDQGTLRAFHAVVRRNAIGRQRQSFETELTIEELLDSPAFPGIFIRSPVVEEVADGVEVLATHDGRAVLCADGRHLFATFHPELTADGRIHQLFLQRAGLFGTTGRHEETP